MNIKVNMPVHLKKIKLSEVTAGREQDIVTAPGGWRVFAISDDLAFSQCEIYDQISRLPSLKDQKSAILALTKLLKVAATGDQLQVHYNEKQCHELFRFSHLEKEHIVWRIRNGDVRIAFYYTNGKLIFLPGILVKRRNKLRKNEENFLAEGVKRLLDAEQNGSLTLEA